MKANYTEKAIKKVEKAVSVFDKAITEVESAQALMIKAVEEDGFTISALNTAIVKMQGEIADTKAELETKKTQMLANDALLVKLKQFKSH